MPEAKAVTLTLRQRIVIGLVPSTVPALVLIIALGIAVGIGELPESLGNAFEQIAGGALLITYMKELFPKVMESGDPAVAAIIKGSTDKSTVMHAKIAVTVLIVLSIATSAILQTAAAGFPGLNPEESGSGTGAEHIFTPAETIAYFIGFFVDGVVLAYDDEPVACDLSLVKKMIMSLVFAIDNLLDGFGLVPVLKEAFGESWWVIMFVFAGCVIAGALTTAMLLHCIPSPLFHTCFLSLATTSILVGALELTPHGLSVHVCIGIVAVWFVLFVGDLVSESDEEEGEGAARASNWECNAVVTTEQIDKDLSRAGRLELGVHDDDAAAHREGLRQLLSRWVSSQPTQGYHQAMCFIGASLLHAELLDVDRAYASFAAVMRSLPAGYYGEALVGCRADVRALRYLAASRWPDICGRAAIVNEPMELMDRVCTQWLLALYGSQLSAECCRVVWHEMARTRVALGDDGAEAPPSDLPLRVGLVLLESVLGDLRKGIEKDAAEGETAGGGSSYAILQGAAKTWKGTATDLLAAALAVNLPSEEVFVARRKGRREVESQDVMERARKAMDKAGVVLTTPTKPMKSSHKLSCASCARATVDLFVRRSGEPGSLSHRLRQFRGRRGGFGSDDAAFASESEMPRV